MFTPKSNYTGEKKEFVAVVPEDGLQAMQVALLVDLGQHEKLPKYAKDSKGNIELDDNGNKKILWPNKTLTPHGARKDLDFPISVYVDLLNQTHDYGPDIGVRNIRLPLQEPVFGIASGVNWTTVAPKDANNNYIKGRPWTLAPSSKWAKLADVTKYPDGKKVKDVIMHASYDNALLNDTRELLGKPFMANVEVKVSDKDGKKFVNTKIKSYVPTMKGVPIGEASIAPVAVSFFDDDLLEKRDDLGGASKLDLLRVADLRKIVLAINYEGSNIQAAIRSKYGVDGEKELIAKAKEARDRAIASDKELQEIYATTSKNNEREEEDEDDTPAPSNNIEDIESDLPF